MISIGYFLLVSFAIIMSAIIYTWLKTYTPSETLECPGSTSFFITSIACGGNYNLNLTLRNNGKFDIGGYLIRGAITPGQDLAVLDLSGTNESAELNTSAGDGGLPLNPGVKFLGEDNPMKPGEERTNEFILSLPATNIHTVEIIPIRYQEQENKKRLVICGDSKITEKITCG